MCAEYQYSCPANGCLALELQERRDGVQSAKRGFLYLSTLQYLALGKCNSATKQHNDQINEPVIKIATLVGLLKTKVLHL